MRSVRARATRERIVPTGTPHTLAASSYEAPTTCVSTNASRLPTSRRHTRSSKA